jgi:hypothetical protein
MHTGLKLIIPRAMRDSALNLLQAGGYDAASNGTGLRVTVSPSAKTAPIQTLLDANIEISDFDVDNEFQE